MSKNLEELKKIRDYLNHKIINNLVGDNIYIDIKENINTMISILSNSIPLLEDHEKRLKKAEIELGIYTEEEIKKIKVGGTDPN